MSEAAARGGEAAVRWTYRLVLAGGFLLLWRLNAPGHMSVDSVLALHEGRFHVRETWNPAIFGWLLGQADSLVPGQALAMGASAAMLFTAWAAMASLRPRASWFGVVLALLAIGLPQTLIYPAIVWKDVWFTEATVAGFVALAFALKSPVPAARWGLLGLAALLLAVAGLLRQNGLILAGAGAVAIAWAGSASAGWRSSILSAAVWLIAVAAAALTLSTVAQPQGMGRPDDAGGKGVRLLTIYDVVGATARQPLPLHEIDKANPALDDQIRAQAKVVYSPQRIDYLTADPKLGEPMAAVPDAIYRAEWLDLITQHPRLYLATRAEVFRWVFQTPAIDACLPIHVGVEGPAGALADLRIPAGRRADDGRLYNYVTWFLDTPAYSHVTYALIALVVGLMLLWRRDPADLAIAGLMGGSLAFAASFFVISIACDYRYLYLVDIAAVTGVLYLGLDPRLTRRKGRRRARD